mmetsp:Transcript_27741/g.44647  ORF Transcript_27741/g.44647 Transcript_27741/m.44647 type:complete len:239 (-) Transcript_27741:17-733(-)
MRTRCFRACRSRGGPLSSGRGRTRTHRSTCTRRATATCRRCCRMPRKSVRRRAARTQGWSCYVNWFKRGRSISLRPRSSSLLPLCSRARRSDSQRRSNCWRRRSRAGTATQWRTIIWVSCWRSKDCTTRRARPTALASKQQTLHASSSSSAQKRVHPFSPTLAGLCGAMAIWQMRGAPTKWPPVSRLMTAPAAHAAHPPAATIFALVSRCRPSRLLPAVKTTLPTFYLRTAGNGFSGA